MQKITTFLMFDGQAEEAMNYYTSLFGDGGERMPEPEQSFGGEA